MRKVYRVYRVTVILFTLLTFFCTVAFEKGEGYEYISLIPLAFLIFFTVCKRFNRYSEGNTGLFLLNILMFLKYVVTIFFTCTMQTYSVAYYYVIPVKTSSFHWATAILIGEMVSVFAIVELLSDKFYGKAEQAIKPLTVAHEQQLGYKLIRKGPVIYLFMALGFILVAMNPVLFFDRMSILFSSGNVLTEKLEYNNGLNVIFGAFKNILIGLPVNYCIVKYQETKKTVAMIWSYLLIFVLCLLNVSLSRINIILPFLFFVLITSKAFEKKGRILNISIGAVLGLILGIVSVYKMPYIATSSSKLHAFFLDFTKRLQEYTSNILPTAIGLQAIEAYSDIIGPHTFFLDIIGSTPLISHIVDEKDTIYTLYNQYALGGSSNTQIIPMTISSIGYFSPVFAFLLVDVCVIALMKLEQNKNRHADNFIDSYIHLYLIFTLAFCLFGNVQMLTGRFFSNFFATFVIMGLNKIVTFGKSRLNSLQ